MLKQGGDISFHGLGASQMSLSSNLSPTRYVWSPEHILLRAKRHSQSRHSVAHLNSQTPFNRDIIGGICDQFDASSHPMPHSRFNPHLSEVKVGRPSIVSISIGLYIFPLLLIPPLNSLEQLRVDTYPNLRGSRLFF